LAHEDEAANSCYQLGLPLHTSQPGSGWSSHRSRNLSNLGKYFGTTITKRVLQKKTFLKGHITKEKKIVEVFFA
jgi:hypothetical protein